jgi:hypothetical protein
MQKVNLASKGTFPKKNICFYVLSIDIGYKEFNQHRRITRLLRFGDFSDIIQYLLLLMPKQICMVISGPSCKTILGFIISCNIN